MAGGIGGKKRAQASEHVLRIVELLGLNCAAVQDRKSLRHACVVYAESVLDTGEFPEAKTKGIRLSGTARLQISVRERRRKLCDLEFVRTLPRLPQIVSRLHPQPCLGTRPKCLRQPNHHLR